MRKTIRIFLSPHRLAIVLVLFFSLLMSSCAPQVASNISDKQFGLSPSLLKSEGIAFMTPSTVTGQEEEKQAVAFVFFNELAHRRPDLKLLSLPETLAAVNRAGLTDAYKDMYHDYKNTGLFNPEILREVADATGTRYAAQLKLAGFTQGSSSRFSVFGLRLVETKKATLRLFFQIWDAYQGKIVWEALQELSWSEELVTEDVITLQTVIAEAAKNIGSRLPR